jgi:hypothetical protein
LPAVYPFRYFVTIGGLISYGPNPLDQYRRAAGYVDRILRGEKPADLPVQAPTKYELVINLKTAKALGIEIPSSVLARCCICSRQLVALLGPREMSDLSPQSGPKQTLIRSLSRTLTLGRERNAESLLPFKTGFAIRVTAFRISPLQSAPATLQSVK